MFASIVLPKVIRTQSDSSAEPDRLEHLCSDGMPTTMYASCDRTDMQWLATT